MSSQAKRRRSGVQRLTFGQWLSDRMAQCGYDTDLALAHEIEIRDTTIGRWRKDRAKPSIDQLRKLADALKVGIPELLVRSGHATSDELGLDAEMFEQQLDPGLAMIDESNLEESVKSYLRASWLTQMRQARNRLASQIEVLEQTRDFAWRYQDDSGREFLIKLVRTSLQDSGLDLPSNLLHDLARTSRALADAVAAEEAAAVPEEDSETNAPDQDKSNIHSIK